MNDGLDALHPIPFAFNNCGQCWNCKRKEGDKVLYNEQTKLWFNYPICSLSGGVIRTEVYFKFCTYWEKEEKREITENEIKMKSIIFEQQLMKSNIKPTHE